MQVRWVDQTQYPEDTIESFVGQSSMGLLCPPADLKAENLCKQVVHTHTHQQVSQLLDRYGRADSCLLSISSHLRRGRGRNFSVVILEAKFQSRAKGEGRGIT